MDNIESSSSKTKLCLIRSFIVHPCHSTVGDLLFDAAM